MALDERITENEEKERAILVGVRWGRAGEAGTEESLDELMSLAETAGAAVVGTLVQVRTKPDPATLLGKGKLAELGGEITEKEADLVIFDQELTPSQQRNLENDLKSKVLDRTALILDIFALHAHSKEGKAQVEMAQLRYQLTRLTGRGTELSRLGGGIGTRGPGETKLEVDRRRINARIKTLDRELKDLSRIRRVKRKRRERQSIPTFALVGYTNAGKSSILNILTRAGVIVEDQLFSTLDPTTRRIMLPGNRRGVLTDTVGFINHLPHQLVEAFKSTLEEVKEAEVLMHIVDASSTNITGRMAAVEEVLDEIDASGMPTIYILNKADLLDEETRVEILKKMPFGLLTSTRTGEGLSALRERMAGALQSGVTVMLLIPISRGDILTTIYQKGHVLGFVQEDDAYEVTATLPASIMPSYRQYLRDQGGSGSDEEGR
jgi:GTP-binding protein HflX